MYFVYLLRCADGSLYCGYSMDLNNRINEHNAGEGAAWTKKRRPVQLVYFERQPSLTEACQREKQIKGWSVQKKMKLISGTWC